MALFVWPQYSPSDFEVISLTFLYVYTQNRGLLSVNTNYC
jgi:hypothetical protein